MPCTLPKNITILCNPTQIANGLEINQTENNFFTDKDLIQCNQPQNVFLDQITHWCCLTTILNSILIPILIQWSMVNISFFQIIETCISGKKALGQKHGNILVLLLNEMLSLKLHNCKHCNLHSFFGKHQQRVCSPVVTSLDGCTRSKLEIFIKLFPKKVTLPCLPQAAQFTIQLLGNPASIYVRL